MTTDWPAQDRNEPRRHRLDQPARIAAPGKSRPTVDLISKNGRSLALRLHDKPSWVRIGETGVFLHRVGPED